MTIYFLHVKHTVLILKMEYNHGVEPTNQEQGIIEGVHYKLKAFNLNIPMGIIGNVIKVHVLNIMQLHEIINVAKKIGL